MDLYDYLLSVCPSRLIILARNGGVRKTVIRYSEIQALQVSRLFLKGVLIFHLKSETVQASFNTVSIDVALRLVNLSGSFI